MPSPIFWYLKHDNGDDNSKFKKPCHSECNEESSTG